MRQSLTLRLIMVFTLCIPSPSTSMYRWIFTLVKEFLHGTVYGEQIVILLYNAYITLSEYTVMEAFVDDECISCKYPF